MSVVKNLFVKGNLTVSGTTSSVSTENVLVKDRFMLINSELTAGNESGGIAINHTVIASVSATAFTNSGSVITCGDLTGSITDTNADFILVSGSVENNGIYEVLTRTATSITIATAPAASYLSNTILTDETVNATISAISICIIQSNTSGILQTSTASNGTNLNNFSDVLTTGGSLLAPTLSLTGDSNQIILDSDGANPTTLSTEATPGGSYTYTIPDVGGAADFIMTAGVQTITGVKTFSGVPVISTITNMGTLTLPTIDDTLVGRLTTDVLSNKTLTLPQINDTTADHQYVFNVSELTADRNVALPLLAAHDEFIFANHPQVLTNKSVAYGITAHADTAPTLTVTSNTINTFTPSIGRVVTLPAVATAGGYTYKFILLSGAGSCILTASTGTIEGLSTFTLDSPNQSTSLTSDGGVWRINL
jgi:hypothetical protein